MNNKQSQAENAFKQRLKLYFVFTKFRLTFSVVLSALSGYLFNGGNSWLDILFLSIGGILVTAASNGSNQIWERETDKMMNRTKKRPLPAGTMSLMEAYIVVFCSLIIGLFLLALLNIHSVILGFSAYLSYVFIYTPLKRITPWAVLAGAFPGAIPPMLGAIAASGEFSLVPGVLFFVQFIWQFPHFWAIAWMSYDDYRAGGFSLLPSKTGRSKNSALLIVIYSLFLIPLSLIPWLLNWTGGISLIVATICGGLFYISAYRLYQSCETKDAKKLMYASIIYLPIIQFLYYFDRTPSFIEYINVVVQ